MTATPRCGRRRGRRPPAIAVSIDGNGRRVAADPYRGAVEAVLECCGQPRLRRRRAARAHELPELRQPGEAAHRLAAHARRSPASATPAARSAMPGRRRQRLALQRGRRGPDLPDAGRRPGRRAAGRARAPGGSASRTPGDAIALIAAGSWAPSLAASELSKLRGEAVAGPLPRADLGELQGAARRDPPGRPRRRAALRARRRRGRRRGRAGRVRASPAASARAVHGLASEEDLFGEGPGAFLVSGPRQALTRVRRRRARDRRGRRRRARRSRACSACRWSSSSAPTRAASRTCSSPDRASSVARRDARRRRRRTRRPRGRRARRCR